MRTTSFALLFSAVVAAPAFASGDGTEPSLRPVAAAPQQPGTAARAGVHRDRPTDDGIAQN
jgi:hypothetical protein